MGADKGKKMKIEEHEEEDLEIDENLILSIEKLEELQDELEKVNEEACEKVLEVEQKYTEIRKPVYIKREEVIKTIPDFWATSFVSHPYLNGLLGLEDQKVFKYLSSLEVEDFKDVKSGYSITFNFKPNPYFEDTKLSKTFFFPENEITKVTGTTIKWKEGMDIAVGANWEIPNGVNHEKKGKKRSHVDDRLSFFCWFSDTKPDDITEEFDDEVAEVIKEELWTNPLKFYNYGDGDEDGEDDDDQSDEEDNNDEDDDNEEDDADEET